MTKVHVIVEDVEGLAISAAVDKDGTIWVVLNPNHPDPYKAFADVMADLVGCLPDVCTYQIGARPRSPADLQLVLS